MSIPAAVESRIYEFIVSDTAAGVAEDGFSYQIENKLTCLGDIYGVEFTWDHRERIMAAVNREGYSPSLFRGKMCDIYVVNAIKDYLQLIYFKYGVHE